jgi:hypothetical protein
MAGTGTLGKRMWPLIRDMPQLRHSVQSQQNQSQTERKLIKTQKSESRKIHKSSVI